MLKRLLNEAVIGLKLQPDGALLVKSGHVEANGVDMSFVRTWCKDHWEVFLPGTSLKGMMRAHAERIARTLKTPSACDPFSKEDRPATWFCGGIFKKREDEAKNNNVQEWQLTPEQIYHDSCPACRLFGSTHYGSRFAIGDAYAEGTPPTPQERDGVGIDRFTGGASSGAKFNFEVITEGEFSTTVHIRNFELWQLGWLGYVFQDLKDGFIRLGLGKSRGMGGLRGEVTKVALSYLGNQIPRLENGELPLWGVGKMMQELGLEHGYNFYSNDEVSEVDYANSAPNSSNGWRTVYEWPGDKFPWMTIAEVWNEYIGQYETADDMKPSRGLGGG